MSAVLEPVAIPRHHAPETQQFVGTITLCLPEGFWSDEDFLALCQANQSLALEIDQNGSLIIMPPADTDTGFDSMDIGTDLNIWNRQTKRGRVGDSNTAFRLPNGAIRAPDVSWISKDRLAALRPEQRKPFARIAPDFVVELMSPSDRLSDARAKMREYQDNGVRLGWLINPKTKQVEVYEPGKDPVMLQDPKTISGDPVLAGFVLDLTEIWK